jgi:PEP-CTERM motif
LGWYNLVGNQIFRHGLVTRFDLNSINGPVPGGAFVDPPSSSDYFIDWSATQFAEVATPSIPDPEMTFCSPTDPQCNPLAIPSEIAALNYTGFGAVPEPSTWAMMLVGFGGLALAAYRQRRGLASRPMLG